MVNIYVSADTHTRLQMLATPFRRSERGTPDKVIRYLLDEYERHAARQRLGYEEPLPRQHPAEPGHDESEPGRVY